ncbi:MAG: hypothetical protein V3W03_06290, partial [Gammaproteobacteria bacterium]
MMFPLLSIADGHSDFDVPYTENHSRYDVPFLKDHSWYPVNWQGLPEPYHTDSANNPPRLIAQPEDVSLLLPDGFIVEEYLSGFLRPRFMLLGPDNEILLSDIAAG